MKTENEKFGFNLENLMLSETCKFSFEFPSQSDLSLFIDLCNKGKLYASFGTKDAPNLITAYEYTFETTAIAGQTIYIMLNLFRDKKRFMCFSLYKQDMDNIIKEFAIQYITAFAKAA
ncbi:MAG: hypothetical protein ACOXZQ_06730 [Bacteroidales bacterium]|jgi:hypothetical protein|nr:MAG: hypothetical protein BWX72_00001 [Firmicutes bacterium ADurb.Bin080]